MARREQRRNVRRRPCWYARHKLICRGWRLGRSKTKGDGELRSDMTVMEGMCGAPVHGSNDAYELGEVVDVVRWAPRRKHVVGLVMDVIPFRL